MALNLRVFWRSRWNPANTWLKWSTGVSGCSPVGLLLVSSVSRCGRGRPGRPGRPGRRGPRGGPRGLGRGCRHGRYDALSLFASMLASLQ